MSICMAVFIWISTDSVGFYYPPKNIITATSCITAYSLPFSTLFQPPYIPPPPPLHHHPHHHHHHHHHDCIRTSNLHDGPIYMSTDEMLHCPTSPCNPHDHNSACMACDRLWALYMKITLTNSALQPVMKANRQSWGPMSGYEIHDRACSYADDPNSKEDLQWF